MMQPPPMNQQHMQNPAMPMPQQHWAMMAPQYPQGQSQTMWGQQSSQIPPPVQVPQPQQHQLPPQNFSHYGPQAGGMTPGTMQQQLAQQSQASSDEIRALWIGDLQYWMDENYIFSCFAQTGEVLSVKIIRNKQTQQSEGYGFIEFASRSMAQQVLQTYNGQMMPNVEQAFKLNWASLGSGERRGGDDGTDYTIFVGDLAPEVTDYMLQETFKSCYPSVKGAKIVTDRATGRSKGYGFVKFGDLNEQSHAMTEMNGVLCSSRPMRIGPASNKNNGGIQQQNPTKAAAASASASAAAAAASSYQQTQQGTDSENDPNNTTIFVGGLDSTVTEDMLRQAFGPYGELVHVKIPVGKRCGFVQYSNRGNAEEALRALNGSPMGGQNIRLSWGRTPLFKQGQQQQQQEQSSQWNGNYYAGGYSQGYGGAYGYAAAAPQQDPNLYAYASYQGGYPNFHQQQPNQQ